MFSDSETIFPFSSFKEISSQFFAVGNWNNVYTTHTSVNDDEKTQNELSKTPKENGTMKKNVG